MPASSPQTVRTVPSPPQTRVSAAPPTAAASAIERPGSSTVVKYQSGVPYPAAPASCSTTPWNSSTLSTLIGLRMQASLRPVGTGLGARGAALISGGEGSNSAVTINATATPPRTR